jgi:TolB-like protein
MPVDTGDVPESSNSVDKPSIAVLPFLNMSDDPEQEYFSDGITEDIITGLSRFRELFVIARGSSFAFKGQSVDVTAAAEKLGARYVLEGSVRKAGERVRITAQLSDAAAGNHLWVESYDRVLEDVFAVQDDVAQKIISTLAVRLEEESRERAIRKSLTNLSAYDCYLRGKHCFPDWHGSEENVLQARAMFERALELDPNYALAYSGLTETYLAEAWAPWTPNHDAAAERTFECARKAVELDNRDSHAHNMLACAYLYVKGNFELAELAIQKAIDLNPNDYWNYCLKTEFSMWSGDFEDSNAIKTFARISEPGSDVQACIAACFAQLGRDEDARTAAAVFHDRIKSEIENQSWDVEGWHEYWTNLFTFKNPDQLDHLFDGLAKAGLIEQPAD